MSIGAASVDGYVSYLVIFATSQIMVMALYVSVVVNTRQEHHDLSCVGCWLVGVLGRAGKERTMNGLWVALGTVVGGGLGFGGGMLAAIIWADMELGNLDALIYPVGGMIGGALTGAFMMGQLVG